MVLFLLVQDHQKEKREEKKSETLKLKCQERERAPFTDT